MEPDELIGLHSVYHEAIENAEKDPYHYGFRLPHWGKAEEQLFEVNEILALGGNRCLAPEQEIYDPVSKQSIAVSKIKGDFHVLAWDGEKQIQCRALQPFVKTVAKTYQVILGSGDSFQCSAEHQVSTPFGWRSVKDRDRRSSFDSAERFIFPLFFWPSRILFFPSALQHGFCPFKVSAKCFALDSKTSRFSVRLSVFTPFLWWTTSFLKRNRPKCSSITRRCSRI